LHKVSFFDAFCKQIGNRRKARSGAPTCKAGRIWEFLNAIPAATLLGEGRVYGVGLYKLEPKELANVPAEFIAGLVGTDTCSVGSQPNLFATKAA